jgi:hypothetical protein
VPIVLAAVLGCGSKRPTKIKGLLILDGRPLSEATVLFMPDGEEKGRPASGTTTLEGEFQLTTYKTRDGVLPGNYRVLVQKTTKAPDPGTVARNAEGRAKLKYEMKTRNDNLMPLIPPRYSTFDTTPLRCTIPAKGVVLLELEKDAARQ